MGEMHLALTALTGGGTGALDKIDGNDLSDGHGAVVKTSSGSYVYHLNATSGATEKSPYVIAPDTNPGTKRWVLVTPHGPFSHVRAGRSTLQSVPDATDTIIIFNSESYDKLSEFNTTTGGFTALYAGLYSISSFVTFEGVAWSSGKLLILNILVDSVVTARGHRNHIWGSDARQMTTFVSTTLELSAGEVVTIQVYQNRGSATNIYNDAARTYLAIDRLP